MFTGHVTIVCPYKTVLLKTAVRFRVASVCRFLYSSFGFLISMAKRRMVEDPFSHLTQFRMMSLAVAFVIDDDADDYLVIGGIKRPRTHTFWMRPYLRQRTDPNQRNTLAKLEADFIRLGCVSDFRKTTRMSPDVYKKLLEKVRPLITYSDTNYREAITAEERLSITIRYLTRGNSVTMLHQAYLVGESTVLPLVRDTCKAIFSVLHEEYLKSPSTEEGWFDIAQVFHDRWNMPHLLGALDGKHVRIQKPDKSGSLYYNYKQYFSIILFALVDAEYRFVYVDVGAEGKASDSTLWKYSAFHQDMGKPGNPLNLPAPAPFPGYPGNLPYHFCGDDAFEMSEQLMKPYPTTRLSMQQRIFNYRLSRVRRVVKNAFGILATRFRIFRREIEMSPENATVVVLACVALHNYLQTEAPSAYLPKEATDWEGKDYSQHRGVWRGERAMPEGEATRARNRSERVKDMRNNLARWCMQKEGELQYQYEVVLQHDFYFDR